MTTTEKPAKTKAHAYNGKLYTRYYAFKHTHPNQFYTGRFPAISFTYNCLMLYGYLIAGWPLYTLFITGMPFVISIMIFTTQIRERLTTRKKLSTILSSTLPDKIKQSRLMAVELRMLQNDMFFKYM